MFWKKKININKNHSFMNTRGKIAIKYVDPTFDLRTNDVFYIRFRGIMKDGEKSFDYRDNNERMYERIVEWLNSN